MDKKDFAFRCAYYIQSELLVLRIPFTFNTDEASECKFIHVDIWTIECHLGYGVIIDQGKKENYVRIREIYWRDHYCGRALEEVMQEHAEMYSEVDGKSCVGDTLEEVVEKSVQCLQELLELGPYPVPTRSPNGCIDCWTTDNAFEYGGEYFCALCLQREKRRERKREEERKREMEEGEERKKKEEQEERWKSCPIRSELVKKLDKMKQWMVSVVVQEATVKEDLTQRKLFTVTYGDPETVFPKWREDAEKNFEDTSKAFVRHQTQCPTCSH